MCGWKAKIKREIGWDWKGEKSLDDLLSHLWIALGVDAPPRSSSGCTLGAGTLRGDAKKICILRKSREKYAHIFRRFCTFFSFGRTLRGF